MSVVRDVGLVLQAAGVLVVLMSALSLLRAPSVPARLHAVTPATSLGVPLLGVGLALRASGVSAALTILLAAAIVTLTTPAVNAATARGAQRR